MDFEYWLDWGDWALPLRVYMPTHRYAGRLAGVQIGPLVLVLSWWREEE